MVELHTSDLLFLVQQSGFFPWIIEPNRDIWKFSVWFLLLKISWFSFLFGTNNPSHKNLSFFNVKRWSNNLNYSSTNARELYLKKNFHCSALLAHRTFFYPCVQVSKIVFVTWWITGLFHRVFSPCRLSNV